MTKDLRYSDIFFKYCDELLSEMVVISLKSGKVYVGVMNAATYDPNEPHRFVKIIPILSGYRNNTKGVIFTIKYISFEQKPESVVDLDVLILLDEISTLAKFNFEIHDEFIKKGITKLMPNMEDA